jgi:CheY-like chemotaxis protein
LSGLGGSWLNEAIAVRLLVVEDDYLIAKQIVAALRCDGIEVAALVGSVAGALQAIEAETLDAAILDVNLRGHTSLPVASALRERGIPYLVYSGYAPEHCQDVIGNGSFLTKPAPANQLARAAQKLMGSNPDEPNC